MLGKGSTGGFYKPHKALLHRNLTVGFAQTLFADTGRACPCPTAWTRFTKIWSDIRLTAWLGVRELFALQLQSSGGVAGSKPSRLWSTASTKVDPMTHHQKMPWLSTYAWEMYWRSRLRRWTKCSRILCRSILARTS